MTRSLAGRTVALAEGRQLEELAQLLEAEGATALRYPLLSILDAPDSESVLRWLRDLVDGRFGLVVLMTGEAVRRLLTVAERAGLRADFVAALGRSKTVTRGPKPARALKELGLAPSLVAQAPTTQGVIATLMQEAVAGQLVAYTLAGVANPALEQFLVEAGATPRSVLAYVYAPASSGERVADLIDRLAKGIVDVLIFTSSPQIDRLLEVARERGSERQLRAGMACVRIAAIGPVVADTLKGNGWRADICPEQGWVMKNLVQHIKRDLERGPA